MDSIALKHAALVRKLYNLTKSGKIEWSNDNFKSDLQVELGSYLVVLENSVDDEGTPYEIVKLRNSGNNTQIDSFNDSLLSDIRPEIEGFNDFWRLMTELREMALRQARHVDEALAEIMSELDKADDDLPF